jgi:two-component system response regulator AtoC
MGMLLVQSSSALSMLIYNVIEYSIVMASGKEVGVHDLPEYLKNIQVGLTPEEQCLSLRPFIGLSLRELEDRFIKETLDALAGHRRKTAKILGISERNLRYRLNSGEGA